MSLLVNISKSARSTSAKAARISCRRFLACLVLAKSTDEESDNEEFDEGILKLYPSRWAPKYDTLVMSIWSETNKTPQTKSISAR